MGARFRVETEYEADVHDQEISVRIDRDSARPEERRAGGDDRELSGLRVHPQNLRIEEIRHEEIAIRIDRDAD